MAADIYDEMRILDARIRSLEIELSHLPKQVSKHDDRLKGLEIFKAQVLVLAAAGSVIGGILSTFIQHLFK